MTDLPVSGWVVAYTAPSQLTWAGNELLLHSVSLELSSTLALYRSSISLYVIASCWSFTMVGSCFFFWLAFTALLTERLKKAAMAIMPMVMKPVATAEVGGSPALGSAAS